MRNNFAVVTWINGEVDEIAKVATWKDAVNYIKNIEGFHIECHTRHYRCCIGIKDNKEYSARIVVEPYL